MQDINFRSDMRVELVKSSASDSDLVWSARVSTKGERSLEDLDINPERTEGLIKYLIREKHSVPSEHTSFTFYIEAPIFITREILKHRLSSISETSGRYRVLTPDFYVPEYGRPLQQIGKTGNYEFEQGSDDQYALTANNIEAVSRHAWTSYEEMINLGVAKEVARMCLPLNIYSSMYMTMNARALTNFISLRTEDENADVVSHPQYEIQKVAEQMETHFADKMPITYKYFNEFGRKPL